MPDLKEKCVGLLSSTSVDLNSAATTNLYTVPSGKTAWISHVAVRDISADASAAEITMGQTGDKDDWCKKLLLGKYLNAAQDTILIQPRMWLQESATWNPGSIDNGDAEAKEVTLDDAELGDFAIASFSVDVADLALNAAVTANGTVTATLSNSTGGAVDLASGTLRVRVFKYDAGYIEYTAAEIFCVEVTTAAGGACTATFDVFGYIA